MRVVDTHRKNLCKRHLVSEAEIQEGVDIISKGLAKIENSSVVVAIAELLLYGDISVVGGDEDAVQEKNTR